MSLDDDEITNRSGNRSFREVLEASKSRRQVLTGGLGFAATSILAPAAGLAQGYDDDDDKHGGKWEKGRRKKRSSRPKIDFTPVPVEGGGGAVPRISDEYQFQTLIPWGAPLNGPSNTPFDRGSLTSGIQAESIGIGHDGMWFFPIRGRNDRGMLAINHEFGTNGHVLGKAAPESLEDVRISQHAHGVSVVEVRKKWGTWDNVPSWRNRRIHVNTEVEFSGPVAGHPLLDTPAGNTPKGTVNNCANGYTPWGTYLTCEENFNGYFGANDPNFVQTEAQQRYGIGPNSGYGWFRFDPRFDLSNPDYRNEEHRFGWIVEIDPMRPWKKATKRTALGRFKHEGIAIVEGRGKRIVGYMGDDQAFDYIYKFVSDKNWKSMVARGKSPLDEGKLYVARFNDDGTGDWIELTIDNPDIQAFGFTSQEQVLTFARLAADAAGATPMDRPEWTTVGPDGHVYCTLTNNGARSVPDAVYPFEGGNSDGSIIRWMDSDDHIGLTFEWDIFVFAKDTRGSEDVFTDPDGLWADEDGRLFIQTDGGQPDGLNNQMLVACAETGELKRILEGVAGDEITGVAITPDRRTMFVNVQHPGNGNPSATNLPVLNEVPDGVTVPRDVTLVITRKDGGIIGS